MTCIFEKNVLELYTFGKGLYSISGGFQIEEALQPGLFEAVRVSVGFELCCFQDCSQASKSGHV